MSRQSHASGVRPCGSWPRLRAYETEGWPSDAELLRIPGWSMRARLRRAWLVGLGARRADLRPTSESRKARRTGTEDEHSTGKDSERNEHCAAARRAHRR